MNQTENMLTAEDRQVLTAWRLIGQGIAILLKTPNTIMGDTPEIPQSIPTVESKAAPTKAEADKPQAEPEKTKATEGQDKTKAAEPAADTPAAKAEAPDGKTIKRSDVERAMAAKIKALAAQGNGPGAIGQLFPKFHGAQCVSDLTDADYPAFLEELSKL